MKAAALVTFRTKMEYLWYRGPHSTCPSASVHYELMGLMAMGHSSPMAANTETYKSQRNHKKQVSLFQINGKILELHFEVVHLKI